MLFYEMVRNRRYVSDKYRLLVKSMRIICPVYKLLFLEGFEQQHLKINKRGS